MDEEKATAKTKEMIERICCDPTLLQRLRYDLRGTLAEAGISESAFYDYIRNSREEGQGTELNN